MNSESILRRYRLVLSAFIVGLVLSGVTAFPLLHELELLASLLGIAPDAAPLSLTGLHFWIATVRDGLRAIHTGYPWLAYGTDWLAYGHIVIALFFLGPWRAPVPNAWVVKIGLVACAGVLPLALICGPIRDIPFYWRLIDCSFGIFGSLPLLYCLRLTANLRSLDSGAGK
jgi:hypothetical protein